MLSSTSVTVKSNGGGEDCYKDKSYRHCESVHAIHRHHLATAPGGAKLYDGDSEVRKASNNTLEMLPYRAVCETKRTSLNSDSVYSQ